LPEPIGPRGACDSCGPLLAADFAEKGSCGAICTRAPAGTPCFSKGTCGDDGTCKCRNQTFLATEASGYLNRGGDVQGWPPGVKVNVLECKSECEIRPSCLGWTRSTYDGSCYLKSHTYAFPLESSETYWRYGIKQWNKPTNLTPPTLIQHEHFLDNHAIAVIRSYFKDTTGHLLVEDRNVTDPHVKFYLKETFFRAAQFFRETLNSSTGFFPERLYFDKWPTGTSFEMQSANSEYPSGEPNSTPDRTYASILYLNTPNTDLRGGKFYLNADNTTQITGKPGLLVGFGTGPEYFYNFTKVTSGDLYLLSLFFTEDAKVANPEFLRVEK